MTYLLSFLGIALSIVMLRFRERIGDFMGEADWMKYTGGVYNVVIILAIFIFLWSIATLTGTTDTLFMPFLYLLPGVANPANRGAPVNGVM